MMPALSVDEIRRITGLDPKRETCQNKCPDHRDRRPCDCYPGYSLESAVRVVRRVEAHYNNISVTPQ